MYNLFVALMHLLFLTYCLLFQLLLIWFYFKGFWQTNPHAFPLTQNLPLLTGHEFCINTMVSRLGYTYTWIEKRAPKLQSYAEDPAFHNVTKRSSFAQMFFVRVVLMYDLSFLSSYLRRKKQSKKKEKTGALEKAWATERLWKSMRDFGSRQTLSLITLVSAASKSVFFCWLCWVHLCMGALWLAELSLWHPVEPCFLLISLAFILMTALSCLPQP